MRTIYCLLVACLFSLVSQGQEVTANDTAKGMKPRSVTLSTDGLRINDTGKAEEKAFDFEFGAVDLGINTLQDKSNYASAAAQEFLNVETSMKNENLFSLRTGKSWNVNVWPVLFKARLVKTRGQKIYLSSGIGLQMYNFRFSKNISYLNNVQPEVIVDTVSFSKNKLGFTYLSVPLAFTLKTRLAKDAWLVYGAGLTGGYRLSSWTKQISGERGKQKNHDAFNFNDFNACVTGEIGIDGIFRIYASYQLTALHESVLNQYPFCIGLRFGGV